MRKEMETWEEVIEGVWSGTHALILVNELPCIKGWLLGDESYHVRLKFLFWSFLCRACEALRNCLPDMLRDATFSDCLRVCIFIIYFPFNF